MVNLLLAVEPCVPCGALAEVASVRVVSTAPAVGAGPISTRHGTQLAVVAIETVRASAGICVFQILWGENRTGFNIEICFPTAARYKLHPLSDLSMLRLSDCFVDVCVFFFLSFLV